MIDCTGVVDSTRTDLTQEINQLKKTVYDYNGNIHRPNYVILYWGQGLSFKGVLQTFDTTYTFFAPMAPRYAPKSRCNLPRTLTRQRRRKKRIVNHRI